MPYIDVIQHENADGELKQIYDDLVEKRGKLAEVHKIQSLNPKSIVNHMDLYMTIMFGKSPLKRYQREMIAVIVSTANECPYCMQHHTDALNHFWKDDSKINTLIKDFNKTDLSDVDKALCAYAQVLTTKPSGIEESQCIENLKQLGVDDRSLLDAALVISYFNFVNRMVLGLGVQLEEEGGKGYEYD
ncbi:peroxidase [Fulvivirga sp. RKSG066]|uniref:peroxidase-related enzyme n=1 Tax=Fulvivirga aurantia TaxID=2529383 RepID=UPI0012BC49D6|nr:peroxidase-related enzyme [Fulvivirga aurantia]MTI19635.1 peroxidase [Fulvivirga aurantia]